MRKLFTVLLAILLLCCALSSCKPGLGSVVSTPGDLEPTDGKHLHVSTGAVDVSAEYTEALCAQSWLDTGSLQYYSLLADGSYRRYQDDELTEQVGSGSWTILRDEQQYLTLWINHDETGTATVMQELELYDSSIYAFGENGESYVWLRMDENE